MTITGINMKHLKLYKIFESKVDDCKDILVELEDMGWRIHFTPERILARDNVNSMGLPWSVIKEFVLRIKDLLGDDFISFKYRVHSQSPENRDKTQRDHKYITVNDLNDMTDIGSVI